MLERSNFVWRIGGGTFAAWLLSDGVLSFYEYTDTQRAFPVRYIIMWMDKSIQTGRIGAIQCTQVDSMNVHYLTLF